PKRLFVIKHGEQYVGCMGLHDGLTADMFSKDARVKTMIDSYHPGTRVGEQGVFVIEHFCPGVPLLIALVSEYAHYCGIQKIAYAAIDVSRKTIDRLGYRVDVCGVVDLDTFPVSERPNYVRWHTMHNPLLCILDTTDAPRIASELPPSITRRVRLSGKLYTTMTHCRLNTSLRAVAKNAPPAPRS
ncbi:MAG: hypothetical protein AAB276_07860, partial [Pseudomonadota bacterium]